MGRIHNFKEEKLIMGVLTTIPDAVPELRKVLEKEYGPIDFQSELLEFNYSPYYIKEMGEGIQRFFMAFARLVPPDDLADIKIRANELEELFRSNSGRKINLDPGLLNLSRLILASTKDNMHRIPLQKGIYGEVTLVFMHQEFHSLVWTYPDYASEEYKKIFTEIRSNLKLQLKQQG